MIEGRTAWLIVAAAIATSACARGSATPATTEKPLEFGARRVQVSVPAGWEALDQGQQKRFRNGELEIVFEDLGPATPARSAGSPVVPEGSSVVPTMDALVEWGLTAVGYDDRRYEVKSRRATTIDGREVVDIETWNRLDHTWPQRLLFVRVGDHLFALRTTRPDDESMRAFESIRDSLRFTTSVPQ